MMIDLSKNENTSYKLDISGIFKQIDSNRYSFLKNYLLNEKLAQFYNLSEDNFLLGVGSGECICLCFLYFKTLAQELNKEFQIISTSPTFEVVLDYAKAMNIDIKRINFDENFSLDIKQIKADKNKLNLIYITNPNNPSAYVLSKDEVDYLASLVNDECYLLLDEAYAEFVEDFYTLDFAKSDYIIHTRTFSKIFSLAALRIGYIIASKNFIKNISKFYNPDKINSLALFSAIYALEQKDFIKEARKQISKNRDILISELKRLQIPYIDSKTNFLLHKIKSLKYNEFMLSKGILTGNNFFNYNRVSIGNEEEIKIFIKALNEAKKLDLV
ncbi:pyridoxal phosphate-dependent aminotransferase [Campylobacter canadensis]|nr:histidinol-phosphate transaminase [Campylobacter canadensis]MBZ7997504.1 histidinol-phosphate aminotransferase family protein [Campylobacter canadensis]